MIGTGRFVVTMAEDNLIKDTSEITNIAEEFRITQIIAQNVSAIFFYEYELTLYPLVHVRIVGECTLLSSMARMISRIMSSPEKSKISAKNKEMKKTIKFLIRKRLVAYIEQYLITKKIRLENYIVTKSTNTGKVYIDKEDLYNKLKLRE